MKSAIIIAIAFVVSAAQAAAPSCKQSIKAVQKDLDALGKYMESGGQLLETKSNKPIEMVKEWVKEIYDEDTEYDYIEWAESIPGDTSEAGTTTAKAAISAIMGTAETWYLGDDESDKDMIKRKNEIREIARKLARYRLTWGYDGGAQGWGGSPANYVLLIDKKCKVVHYFFLGISHD